jgi:hypothetical protein
MKLNWDNANEWEEQANKEDKETKWSWDCNFKLDYDGDLVCFSSRFYPPHYQSDGNYWDGNVDVMVLGESVLKKYFKCDDLDQLKKEVEEFTEHYKKILIAKLRQ